MKILMYITVYLPSPIYGGPTTVAQQQVKELVKRGHEVTVITSNISSFQPYSKEEEKISSVDDATVMYFNSTSIGSKFSLIDSRSLMKWFNENVKNYDIVHLHFARELLAVKLAYVCKKMNVPYFLQTHGMLNKQNGIRKLVDKLAVKKILISAAGVLVLQETEQQKILMVEKDIHTILLPNGIEMNNENLISWDKHNLSKKKILFLARLHPRKRVLDFIEMAKILMNKGVHLNYRIVGPDGGELNEAKLKVQQYGLANNVEFVGAVSKPEAYIEYANSSIYILPSVDEPFPMTVLEALHIGIPTIVTTSIQNKKILDDYNCVAYAAPTPQSLANVLEVLIKDTKASTELSSNGKKIIAEELNIYKVIDTLEEIYINEVS